MRAKDLEGLAVITLSEAHKVGTVSEVLFDPAAREVLAFRINPGGLFAKSEAVLRRDVTAIGNDAITISAQSAVNREDRYPELQQALGLQDLRGMKVVTEQGTLLGTVGEVDLDTDAHLVVRYVLDASLLDRLRHDERAVLPGQVVRFGADNIMIVRESETGAQTEAAARS